MRTLVSARGRGYARVLAHDAEQGAVLLERLGPSLDDIGLRAAEQLEVLASTLKDAWSIPVETVAPWPSSTDKATQLGQLTDELERPDDRGRWGPALDLARAWAEDLSVTRSRGRDVVCHGDPHPGNGLTLPPGLATPAPLCSRRRRRPRSPGLAGAGRTAPHGAHGCGH